MENKKLTTIYNSRAKKLNPFCFSFYRRHDLFLEYETDKPNDSDIILYNYMDIIESYIGKPCLIGTGYQLDSILVDWRLSEFIEYRQENNIDVEYGPETDDEYALHALAEDYERLRIINNTSLIEKMFGSVQKFTHVFSAYSNFYKKQKNTEKYLGLIRFYETNDPLLLENSNQENTDKEKSQKNFLKNLQYSVLSCMVLKKDRVEMFFKW